MRIIIGLSLLTLAGCASTSAVSTSGLSQTKTSADTFVRAVTVIPIESANKSNCRTPKAKFNRLKWRELVNEANSCVAAAKWSAVYDFGSELAQRDVNSPWGPYYLSLHAESEQLFDRALWMLEHSIKRAPQVGLFYYQKGRVLWKRDDFKEATDNLTKAIQLDTNLIDGHLFLGQIFFRDQDYPRAARHFQAVLRVRPKDPTALMGLAECQLQSGDARGALDLIERGKRNYPNESIFALREAFVHEALLNDVSKAIELYKTIAQEYQNGTYTRPLDFSLAQKIRDLEMSVRGNRAVAGSHEQQEAVK